MKIALPTSSRIALAVSALWAGVVLLGFYRLTAYELRPNPVIGAPREWPEASCLPHTPGRSTLLVFLHPKCPCSRASLDELARVLHESPGADATAVFVKPDGVPAAWEQTTLWREAAQIAGLSVLVDEGGQEARRFAVTASGQTLVYGRDGRLAYEGGLTATRGHYGKNAASDGVLATLQSPLGARLEFPTYGCPLLDEPQSCCKAKNP
jgi:hypothetical protein